MPDIKPNRDFRQGCHVLMTIETSDIIRQQIWALRFEIITGTTMAGGVISFSFQK
jgi:hypothetical protein